MSSVFFDVQQGILEASKSYPLPTGFKPEYGTAGFRCRADKLPSTAFRCGLLAAVRARIQHQNFGIMVTASHNPVQDNGLKLAEPSGEMPSPAWEASATQLACADNDDDVLAILMGLISPEAPKGHIGTVYVGYDTRPSCPALVTAVRTGVEALGGIVHNIGLVTTPQLHYVTATSNTIAAADGRSGSSTAASTAAASIPAYFSMLVDAFEQLVRGSSPLAGVLHVDCANGVGAHQLQCSGLLPRLAAVGLRIELHNTGADVQRLNEECGADYVQKARVLPGDLQSASLGAHDRCCSLDGDADRLVYFSHNLPSGSHQLLASGSGGDAATAAAAAADVIVGSSSSSSGVQLADGDKVAVLAATFIQQLLAGLPEAVKAGLQVGVVQTAYANGASTSYIKDRLGLAVTVTPTGVKHLHAAAHGLDIGIYWEANGHGTVLFSPTLLAKLQKHPDCPAAQDLLRLSRVINQTVGDGFSGILLVEAILRRLSWSMGDWHGLYDDLPSRMNKLCVADRAVITTEDAERRCVTPAGLQDAIDGLVAQYTSARSFVRPSGTEDAVRVYAEAATHADAEELARRVGQCVFDLCGGVGERP